MKNKTPTSSRLIAHRGFSHQFPENTLLAFREAFECGACYVECDIQLTKDKVPVLLHDNNLSRTSGVPAKVHELSYAELRKFTAGFAAKFGARFAREQIPALEEFIDLLNQWPDRKAFIELKRSSIREFGMDETLQNILPLLEKVFEQIIIISFDANIIDWLIASGNWKTGWVVDQWSEQVIEKASSLEPDYLFVDIDCMPAELEKFYPANWHWVVYEIDDPELASKWIGKGAEFIETNDIKQLLESGVFPKSTCGE